MTRLLAAGATIAGKAVCEDLCFSGGSHTSRTGPVRNPWDPTRSAGGSSSGSAALVAAGEVDMATGGDQGGSVRIPSAYSGTVGHKPTHGLVPYTGAFPIEFTIDHLGPMTRTVADAALMLGVMAGVRRLRRPAAARRGRRVDYVAALGTGAGGLRVGVVAEGFGLPDLSDPQVDEAVRAATETLRTAGLKVEDVSVPWHTRRDARLERDRHRGRRPRRWSTANAYGMNWKGLYDPELIEFYGRQWRERAARLSETVKLVMLSGRYAIEHEFGRHYAMARNLAYELTAAYDEALAELRRARDADPADHGDDPAGARTPRGRSTSTRALEMIPNTAPFDVTGHPATSVPAGLVDGLPVGMMIVGRHFDDATCLRVAAAFEEAVGGFPTPPR